MENYSGGIVVTVIKDNRDGDSLVGIGSGDCWFSGSITAGWEVGALYSTAVT